MPIATICLDCNALFPTTEAKAYGRCPGCRPAYLRARAANRGTRTPHRNTKQRQQAQSFYDSAAWKTTRRVIRQRDGACTRCGSTTDLTVHHIHDRKTHPHLELDHDNLTTLCRSCHGVVENARRHA